jgi:hypothetical protein
MGAFFSTFGTGLLRFSAKINKKPALFEVPVTGRGDRI